MAAGQGYIEFATGDVLTASAANGYLASQVVMVFADAAARTTAIASPQEGMISYLKDTNVVEAYDGSAWVGIANSGDITSVAATSPLTGGGTSGAVTLGIQDGTTAQKGAVQLTDSTASTSTTTAATPNSVKTSYDLAAAAIPKSTVTTAGDIIYATGSGAVTRLGVGSTGQVLTVSGGAPSWATAAGGGGTTLLDTLTLSGSSVTSSTFSSNYTQLLIYIKGAYCGVNQQMNLRLNGDTGNNYSWTFVNDGSLAATSSSASYCRIGNIGTSSTVLNQAYQIVTLMRPLDTDKVFVTTAAQYIEGSVQNFDCTGVYDNSAAITSVTLYIGSGSFSGGTAYIYGVK